MKKQESDAQLIAIMAITEHRDQGRIRAVNCKKIHDIIDLTIKKLQAQLDLMTPLPDQISKLNQPDR